MGKALYDFWTNEDAQDLVEYTLLICLVALSAITLLRTQGAGVSTIWVTASTTTQTAATAVS